MRSTVLKLYRWCWVPSVVLYLISLACPAVYLSGFGAPTSGVVGAVKPGYEMLLTLPFAMAAPSWWANPIWLLGVVGLIRKKFTMAWYFGLAATLLALLVVVIGPVPPDFFRFENLHVGYYLWLGSMGTLAATAKWLSRTKVGE